MKKALVIALIIGGFASCSKDQPAKTKISQTLWGKWDLAYKYGGVTVKVANTGDMYQFRSDSSYVRYIDNQVTASGKFHIQITEKRDTLQFGVITFTNPAYRIAWAQTPNTITIGSSAADGPSYEYHKIRYNCQK